MTRVVVLGAGVVGTTVAIALKLLGYDVSLLSERKLGDVVASGDPLFASAYPAASIIPHTVIADGLNAMVSVSDAVFEILSACPGAGVRLQPHFELSESVLPDPEYATSVRNFRRYEPNSEAIPIRRPGAKLVSGVSFDCFFSNMPIYAPWLDALRERLGIPIERVALTPELPGRIDAGTIVNCLGAGASRVYPELSEGVFFRGILLLCDYDASAAPNRSYNYTPEYDIYPGSNGQAADVYFYPRTGHCVLGGTRQAGRFEAGAFVPDQALAGPLIDLGGEPVPRIILDLNRELVRQLTGAELPDPDRVLVGFRHMDCDPVTGRGRVTIASRSAAGLPPHVDCFGFGGAGVTLSWGAAARVAEIVAQVTRGSAVDGGYGREIVQRLQRQLDKD